MLNRFCLLLFITFAFGLSGFAQAAGRANTARAKGGNSHPGKKADLHNRQPGADTAAPAGLPTPRKTTTFWLESGATATGAVVPFWMRANRFGNVPIQGVSGSLIAHAERDYNRSKKRFVDWGFSLEARANAGQQTNLTIIEGHAKIKLGAFEVRGGRSKDVMGFTDTSLSSGSFAISGNALGIPKVEIRVPEFSHILGGKLFAFKGNFAHGWVGEVPSNKQNSTRTGYIMANTFFHQKSLYGRLGKDHWKVRFYGGFNHQVYWGDEQVRFGYFTLSDAESFAYVLSGKMYSGTSSKIGNHLGTIDMGLELNLKNVSILAYRQNFYEVGGLYYLANIQDGLHGISIKRKATGHRGLQVRKFLFEYLYTKNQGGEPWSPDTPTGAENYYNNSEYNEGWSYKGASLGTAFITPKHTARKGFPDAPYDYFINNRLFLYHAGLEGAIASLQYMVKLSYSRNYGTWRTNAQGMRNGGPPVNTRPPLFGVFKPVNQFSSYLEVNQPLKNGVMIGGAFALDNGGLLPNSIGGQVRIVKKF